MDRLIAGLVGITCKSFGACSCRLTLVPLKEGCPSSSVEHPRLPLTAPRCRRPGFSQPSGNLP